MSEILAWTLGNLFLNILGRNPDPLPSVAVIAWQEAEIFAVPTDPDPVVEEIVADYLKKVAALGFPAEKQGVWIQTEWAYLGDNQSKIPLSAASLTKIATSIAALETWGTDHRFVTQISTRGTVKNGVLQGDLIVQGGGDPLFVWEEAIALGNQLNQLGIREVTGNLIIVGNFWMNFQTDPQRSGELLQLGLNAARWTREIEQQYQALPPKTPRPQVAIAGQVQVQTIPPDGTQLLIRHQSLTVAELLKEMNLYSNNPMAEMLAQLAGGSIVVAQTAAKAANLSPEEIQLINGSGLGVENRISPRASVAMLMAIEDKLKDNPLKVSDLFPMAGRDTTGTVQWRNIPDGVAVKTGTLNQVSALAGVMPTKERGQVWFSIINSGSNVDRFRVEQDNLLQRLAQHWQLTPIISNKETKPYLGDPKRNLKAEG
ncbi:peptidase S13 D-Ala-D-Ala carboxypeptidase C [Rippkaea orientalis PCC 8801]|uniref:Peptidase S13 D-Ala-D-Ala carboxypeptidase C n=1 Tax=Rippkaea orientalis (strain PCC 8801 / RF-1) TaxID=41431 RepID=B7JX04_RIPO1|nr:D-alanyl-D-alanine carboxypeptidase [Rippkaea orientalis]ACK65853.1 peptidase S13 D-Ala-D-Ala carboxypeptidase C [Rippkaea orientalis PCC 8801]